MIKVFIAGPYSADTAEGIWTNVTRAMVAFDDLLRLGFAPYCPHFTHFQERFKPQPYEVWMALHREWLLSSHMALSLGSSPGADREMAAARAARIMIVDSVQQALDARARLSDAYLRAMAQNAEASPISGSLRDLSEEEFRVIGAIAEEARSGLAFVRVRAECARGAIPPFCGTRCATRLDVVAEAATAIWPRVGVEIASIDPGISGEGCVSIFRKGSRVVVYVDEKVSIARAAEELKIAIARVAADVMKIDEDAALRALRAECAQRHSEKLDMEAAWLDRPNA